MPSDIYGNTVPDWGGGNDYLGSATAPVAQTSSSAGIPAASSGRDAIASSIMGSRPGYVPPRVSQGYQPIAQQPPPTAPTSAAPAASSALSPQQALMQAEQSMGFMGGMLPWGGTDPTTGVNMRQAIINSASLGNYTDPYNSPGNINHDPNYNIDPVASPGGVAAIGNAAVLGEALGPSGLSPPGTPSYGNPAFGGVVGPSVSTFGDAPAGVIGSPNVATFGSPDAAAQTGFSGVPGFSSSSFSGPQGGIGGFGFGDDGFGDGATGDGDGGDGGGGGGK